MPGVRADAEHPHDWMLLFSVVLGTRRLASRVRSSNASLTNARRLEYKRASVRPAEHEKRRPLIRSLLRGWPTGRNSPRSHLAEIRSATKTVTIHDGRACQMANTYQPRYVSLLIHPNPRESPSPPAMEAGRAAAGPARDGLTSSRSPGSTTKRSTSTAAPPSWKRGLYRRRPRQLRRARLRTSSTAPSRG